MTTHRTRVAIVGAGPAGLLLSHLLAGAGIDSIVFDRRTRDRIETTIRAGILEQGTVEVLARSGASDRVYEAGKRHDGVQFRFEGEGHRIDFPSLIGRHIWLYPQHEVLRDLIAARLRGGEDLRFGTTIDQVEGIDDDHPRLFGTDSEGRSFEVECDFLVGADGSHSLVRKAISGPSSSGHFREYPFAWFGILCEAPQSSEELIYSNSPRGFALISQRSTSMQRMFFQCDPGTNADALSEEQIWAELQSRVPGITLQEGLIFQRDVVCFRSFVARELHRGNAALAGDAAHTVPPTGAKGLNLAVTDVLLLNEALQLLLLHRDRRGIEAYPEAASDRIWKAQHFSWWMTSLLHYAPNADEFDRKRQLGELHALFESDAGQRYIAESYTGWKHRKLW